MLTWYFYEREACLHHSLYLATKTRETLKPSYNAFSGFGEIMYTCLTRRIVKTDWVNNYNL